MNDSLKPLGLQERLDHYQLQYDLAAMRGDVGGMSFWSGRLQTVRLALAAEKKAAAEARTIQ